MKKCSRCGETKEFMAFGKLASSKDGHRPGCKECEKDVQKESTLRKVKLLINVDSSGLSKTCPSCDILKPYRSYNKQSSSKDGLQHSCKECKSKQGKKYATTNKEKIKKRNADSYKNDPEKFKLKNDKWLINNPWYAEKRSKIVSDFRKENPIEVREKDKNYRELNGEGIKASRKKYMESDKWKNNRPAWCRAYRIKNIDLFKSREKKYRVNNPHVLALSRLRRRQCTPLWLTDEDKFQIKNIYKQRQCLSAETGLEYHVDHIVPIAGDIVCGLHVPWNMQVIPASENRSKSNKFESTEYQYTAKCGDYRIIYDYKSFPEGMPSDILNKKFSKEDLELEMAKMPAYDICNAKIEISPDVYQEGFSL